jgi:hypothetical protein
MDAYEICIVRSFEFEKATPEKRHGLFAGCCNSRFEAALGKRIFNYNLNIGVVFDDQNQRQLLH